MLMYGVDFINQKLKELRSMIKNKLKENFKNLGVEF